MNKKNAKKFLFSFFGNLGTTILVLSCSDNNFSGFSSTKRQTKLNDRLNKQGGSIGSDGKSDNGDELNPNIDDGRTGIGSKKVPTKEEISQVIHKCENPKEKQKIFNQTLFYAQRPTTCRFGTDGNLERRQAFITAYETNPGRLELPSGTVCTMQVKSVPDGGGIHSTVRYDDFLNITLDEEIIFFSNNSWMGEFQQNNGVYRWDFAKIVGKEIGQKFEAPAYCIIKSGPCQFPGHDKVGEVNFQFNTTDLAPIVAKFTGRGFVPFNINVTGDNNDTDCIHTPLTLEISMTHVP
jgi:hypothetical protein